MLLLLLLLREWMDVTARHRVCVWFVDRNNDAGSPPHPLLTQSHRVEGLVEGSLV